MKCKFRLFLSLIQENPSQKNVSNSTETCVCEHVLLLVYTHGVGCNVFGAVNVSMSLNLKRNTALADPASTFSHCGCLSPENKVQSHISPQGSPVRTQVASMGQKQVVGKALARECSAANSLPPNHSLWFPPSHCL